MKETSRYKIMVFSHYKSWDKNSKDLKSHTNRQLTIKLRMKNSVTQKWHLRQKSCTNKPIIYASRFHTGIKTQKIQLINMYQFRKDRSKTHKKISIVNRKGTWILDLRGCLIWLIELEKGNWHYLEPCNFGRDNTHHKQKSDTEKDL